MKIKNSYSTDKVIDIQSNDISILADDGREMLSIAQRGNVFQIYSGTTCIHEGKKLDDLFVIEPVAANTVKIVIKER